MRPKSFKIFVVNPGSTSTKIALFSGRKAVFETELKHSRRKLDSFDGIIDQADFRRRAAEDGLAKHGFDPADIDAFVGRGGLLRPVPGGAFKVSRRMLSDLRSCKYGEHASNLGALIIWPWAHAAGKDAYIANPVVVDELSDVARVTGLPAITRRSIFHALSQKAVAHTAAARLGEPYEKLNLIVAHVGGGVTVGAHQKGRVIDVTNGLDGEGPMTPERTGSLPLVPFLKYVQENKLSAADTARLISRQGGLLAHLGTNDCRLIEAKAAAGNPKYKLVYDAFIYQVAKAIGSMAAALAGKVDAIVLTGGVMRGGIIRRELRRMTRFIAPVYVIIRNSEMEALALAALGVVSGAEKAKDY
ncbi:MAG: butyrate kinase [Planctomycetota bacterium]